VQRFNTERASELEISEDIPYTINDIVQFCSKVCENREINPSNVDIMLFSCRSFLGREQTISCVTPKVVA